MQYYIQSAPKKCQPQKSVKIKDSTDIVQKPLFSVSCDTHWGASSVSYNSHISETIWATELRFLHDITFNKLFKKCQQQQYVKVKESSEKY